MTNPLALIDAAIIASDKETAAAKVAEVATEDLPHTILNARVLRAQLSFVEGLCEDRWGREGTPTWHDPDTNLDYVYDSVRRGEFREISQLLIGLLGQGCSPTSLYAAIAGLRITDLETAISYLPEDRRSVAASILADFRVWVSGPAKLQAKDPPKRARKT